MKMKLLEKKVESFAHATDQPENGKGKEEPADVPGNDGKGKHDGVVEGDNVGIFPNEHTVQKTIGDNKGDFSLTVFDVFAGNGNKD